MMQSDSESYMISISSIQRSDLNDTKGYIYIYIYNHAQSEPRETLVLEEELLWKYMLWTLINKKFLLIYVYFHFICMNILLYMSEIILAPSICLCECGYNITLIMNTNIKLYLSISFSLYMIELFVISMPTSWSISIILRSIFFW